MKIAHINKKNKEKSILEDISLSFEKSGLVFILGESGTGKSSLLYIMGLLDTDYEGDIFFGESACTKDEAKRNGIRKRHLGFIFQDYNLVHSLSVKENIMLSVALSGKNFEEKKYQAIMKKLQIKDIEKEDVNILSGGEKQRVSIARAILRQTKIMLADEPTGNLDKENTSIIFDALKEISKEQLVIVVSHNEQAAMEYGDRIIRMQQGRVIGDVDNGYKEHCKVSLEEEGKKENREEIGSWMRRLAINGIKARRKKILPSIGIIVLTLLCSGGILGILQFVNRSVNEINTTILENDKYAISTYNENSGDESVVPSELLDNIINHSNCKKLVPYYSETVEIRVGKNKESLNYFIIENNQFYKERYKDIEGRLGESESEIVINQHLANKLFPQKAVNECIGNRVTLETAPGVVEECEIVGVREVSQDENVSELYINKKLADLFSVKLIDLEWQELGIKVSGEKKEIYTKADEVSNELNVIIGKFPERENEILINAGGFNSLLYELEMNTSYSLEDIYNGKISEKIIKKVFGKKIRLFSNLKNFKELNIVGICKEEKKNDYLICYFTNQLKKNLRNPINNKADIYVKTLDKSTISELKSIAKKYDCTLINAYGLAGMRISAKLLDVTMLLGVFNVLIILLAFVVVHYSTKINVLDRIYEVGVLKSMGARKQEIVKMFMTENILIGLCSSFTALIILFFVNVIKPFKVNGISVYEMSWWHGILIILIGCVVSVLAGWLETYKISNISIVDAIREKNK